MHGAGNYEVLQSAAGVAFDASQHFVIIGLELLDDKPGLRLAGQGIGQVPQRGILRFLRPEVQHQRREIRLVRDYPPLSQLLGTPLRDAADALARLFASPGRRFFHTTRSA
jgi:hypothetical protein